MQLDEVLFSTEDYLTRRLWPADLPLVLTFCQQCADFFILQNGTPPDEAEAEKIFTEVPPGRRTEDILPIGVFDSNNQMVGLLDVLRNYRVKFEWWIGLMLIIPLSRKAGLGTQIHNSFEEYASRCGAQRLLLAVLEKNTEAHRFWTKLGYCAVKNHPPKRYGRCVHACTEYKKTLLSAP
jgi:GNAT superfamily N-acetyltransferase